MNAHAFPQAGAPVAPLRRETPFLHRDGRLKFLAALRFARHQRGIRREIERRGRREFFVSTPAETRLDAVRDDMAPVRQRIDGERAFWSVANLPTQPVQQLPEDAWDFAWSRSAS